MDDGFYEKVIGTIREYEMISGGDRLVVGVSGGADSVCLLHVLVRYRKERQFDMHAVHVHHRIRGEEADRDAEYVRALCAEYGIPFTLEVYDVPAEAAARGWSVEEAGRILRREAFEKKAEELGNGKIALAHHMNDVAETVLFNLSRGSGMAGVSSLRGVRGRYIRPLIGVTSGEIRGWLSDNGISYCEDSTNADSAYTRNLIRSRVLPELTEGVNSQSIRHICEFSEEAGRIERWLAAYVEKCYLRYAKTDRDGICLKKELFAEDPVVYGRAVKLAIGQISGTVKDLSRGHVLAVCSLVRKENGKRVDLPYGLYAESVYGEIKIGRRVVKASGLSGENPALVRLDPESEGSAECGNIRFSWKISEIAAQERQAGKTENIYTKIFDYDKIKGIPEFRYRMTGDYMVINPDGRRKSLSDLLTDRKIPRDERDQIPLLACGSEILWAVGIRGGESCRIGPDTGRVLCVECHPQTREEYEKTAEQK